MLKLFHFFSLYLSLSKTGRKLFRSLYRILTDSGNLPGHRSLLTSIKDNINADRKRWFNCIRASDAGFVEFIPAWYIAQSKIKPELLYYRFFKNGAVLLYEHTSLFLAYNIALDKKAFKRCILLTFLKRVYDDLLDNEGMNKEILFSQFPNKELSDNAEYRLFLELRKRVREMAPPTEFNNYYALLKQVHAAQGSKDPIAYKIKNGFLLDIYMMMNNPPKGLIDALEVTAEFFAYLDNYYDLDEDLARGKLTEINQSADPRKMFAQKFQEVDVYLRANSPNPDAYLKGIENLMQIVCFAREKKLNKLSLFI